MLFDAAPPNWLAWVLWHSESLYRIFLIVGGVIGIRLLYIRTRAADRQARTAEQGHITDRFTKAVEQLGSDKMTVRLGAIYALERISRDSRRDHWVIMETLTAYVRERAPWPQIVANGAIADDRTGESPPAKKLENAAEPVNVSVRPATDIHAILTVLRRRDEEACKRDEAVAERYLDLAETDLRGANLARAHLERANFERAHLEGANLRGAHIEHADLLAAHLSDANLRGAHLEHADLSGCGNRLWWSVIVAAARSDGPVAGALAGALSLVAGSGLPWQVRSCACPRQFRQAD